MAEDEEDGAEDTQARPEVIQTHVLLQIEHGEGNEDGQRNDLLEDLELADVHHVVADAIGGDLDQVFKEGDALVVTMIRIY